LLHLYAEFNLKLFGQKLPEDLPFSWSHKLNSRAGQTFCKKNGSKNIARIVLSTVHIRTYDRLQETLIHEMCHCAEWLIDEVNPSHGNSWKKWIDSAKKEYPHLALTRTCHWEAIQREDDVTIKKEPEDFQTNKQKYAGDLFDEFNTQIFEDELPRDQIQIDWNARWTSQISNTKYEKKGDLFCATITLSSKIVTTYARLAETLCQQLCYAAVWTIHHKTSGAEITTFQSVALFKYPNFNFNKRKKYSVEDIQFKFKYQCDNTTCGQIVQRQRRSPKVEKGICAKCHTGHFVLK